MVLTLPLYIRPVGPEETWTEDCITEFEQLTYCALWKPILAKLQVNHRLNILFKSDYYSLCSPSPETKRKEILNALVISVLSVTIKDAL